MGVDLLPNLERDRAWQPEKWSPRHRLVIAMHVSGDRNSEIGEKLQLSPQYISVILNDPRAVYEIERLAQNFADRTVDTGLRIKLYANEALDEIVEELRTSKNEKLRQTAAFGLLDRAGYVPLRDEKEEAPPMLPEDVVARMEETTRELVEYKGAYREVEPKPIEDVEEAAAAEILPGEPRGVPESE